jgi:hypothetical protein
MNPSKLEDIRGDHLKRMKLEDELEIRARLDVCGGFSGR